MYLFALFAGSIAGGLLIAAVFLSIILFRSES